MFPKKNKKRVYLVMEYAKNGNLFSYVRKFPDLSEAILVDIFIQVCKGLQYIHSFNIMHRDIKPENLLIDDKLQAKICDFGWSTALSANAVRKTFCGTYEYMAPEIFEGGAYDASVDVWSLGILLFELLHGFSPFYGKGIFDIYKNIVANQMQFKRTLNADAKALIKIILQRNPRRRPTIAQILGHPYIMGFQPKSATKTSIECSRANTVDKKQLVLDLNSIISRPPTPLKLKKTSLTARELKSEDSTKPTHLRRCLEADADQKLRRVDEKSDRKLTQPPLRLYKEGQRTPPHKSPLKAPGGFQTDRPISCSKSRYAIDRWRLLKKVEKEEKKACSYEKLVPLSARLKSPNKEPVYLYSQQKPVYTEGQAAGTSVRPNCLLTRYKAFTKSRNNDLTSFSVRMKQMFESRKRSANKQEQKISAFSPQDNKALTARSYNKFPQTTSTYLISVESDNPYFSKNLRF